MDIYRFINSGDIASYLKNTGYEFSPVEIAWLVWQCQTATMRERHAAWEELIRTSPDCKVEKSFNVAGWDSLHNMLRAYMSLERKLQAILEADDPDAVYVYEVLEKSHDPAERRPQWHGETLFPKFTHAITHSQEEPLSFRVCKKYIRRSNGFAYIEGEYDPQGELLRIDTRCCEIFMELTEAEQDLWYDSFDGMWFDFPIPFQKGDIVCDTFLREPFVLLDTDPWCKKRHPERGSHRDGSDMLAFGYSYDREEQFLYDDYMADYMNLTCYNDPLAGGERLLEAYSRFEKGEIDAWTLLRFARMYQCEEIASRDYRRLKSFGAAE